MQKPCVRFTPSCAIFYRGLLNRLFLVFCLTLALWASFPALCLASQVKAFGLALRWKYELRDVSFYVRAGHTPDVYLSFSRDGKRLALGTFEGDLLVFEAATGKIILKKKIPEAMVKRVAFSPDGETLYYGEQGPQGAVCALSLSDGSRKWCFETARDLKRSAPPPAGDLYGIYHLPGIYRLKVLSEGDLLVLGVHSWFDRKRRNWRRLSRIYRLDREGRLKWAYPEKGPAPVTIIYADSDPSGETVAAVALLPSEDETDLRRLSGPPPQSFLVLEGKGGNLIFSYRLKPLKPYFDRISAWESVAVSRDGRWGALGTSDGRLFFFDLKQRSLKKAFSLATPILIGGFPVSATLSYGVFGPRGNFYIISGESTLPYGMPLTIDRPSGVHPSARTLFALTGGEGIGWRFSSPLKLQGLAISRNGKTLAVATAPFRHGKARVRQFGVLVFDLERRGGGLEKLVGYFPTQGTCFFHLAVSPDGRLVAVVELPWKDELGRLFGKHRLLMLERVSSRL